ncbi:putative adhesin [Rickettsiella endosymbiont of Dermanyssus gallinae]|uniref:putative adhesin n=1 Tax=Rickettsiella endosymbiont of Dermanyssus gallinae TaxID=2856608 RepID=UPI001C53021E|nr:hypothetical protein [Rickettsiella endosymbiont of Dermanyssus gallinae]
MPNNNNNTNFTGASGRSTFFSGSDWISGTEDLGALPQDLASFGDEPDGNRFKKQYPKIEIDKNTGETGRVISEVYGHNEDQPIKLDVVAINVGKEKNGKKKDAYLLKTRSGDPLEQVFVDAHGFFGSIYCGDIILKPDMPVIAFLGPHNKFLLAEKSAVNSYAEVSSEGITITSEQARDDFNAFGYKVITGTSTIGAIRNYILMKFVEEPTERAVHYFEDLAAFMDENKKLDIALSKMNDPDAVKRFLKFSDLEGKTLPISDRIQIRKSAPFSSALATLGIAQEHGYKKIIFAFCRVKANLRTLIRFSLPSLINEKNYDPADTKLLEQPLFYSWDNIKKLEMEKGRVSENQEAPSCSTPRMSR